jgi:NAD(P)-dependent dehydrogenase (short-subunit alcohol dehydrogenase family)
VSNVLITGTSSGFGKLAALKFARAGDKVFASMRDTAKGAELEQVAHHEGLDLNVVQLDVTEQKSIDRAVKQVLDEAGSIDVLVNNAGYEVRGAVEEVDDDEARAQFDTNFFGLLRVVRAVLPSMRERGAGRIVNLSSIGGVVAVPFGGMYSASKWAVEAVSEAMQYELKQFGVRVALVEPGAFPTSFRDNIRRSRKHESADSAYRAVSDRFDEARTRLPGSDTPQDPQEVAEAIYNAAYDESPHLRYLVGADANMIATVRKQMDFEGFEQAMRQAMNWFD